MNYCHEDFWNALDELVNTSEIVIDRPKGSAHPRFPDFIYRVDYGYLKNTASMDGAGIDVWVGSGEKKIDAIMCIVDLMKKDSEIKILIGCTEEEKMEVYRTHNETHITTLILIRDWGCDFLALSPDFTAFPGKHRMRVNRSAGPFSPSASCSPWVTGIR